MDKNSIQSEQVSPACTGSEREYVIVGQLYSENPLEIIHLSESKGQTELNRRPFSADYVKAVITVDNKVIPVVDMRDMIVSPAGENLPEKDCLPDKRGSDDSSCFNTCY